MPKTAERSCNLTLTRNEWAVLVALLDNVRSEMSVQVRQCIRAALNAEPDSHRVGIDREVEKWATVQSAVWKDAMKRGGEYNAVAREMTVQLSASRFTEAF